MRSPWQLAAAVVMVLAACSSQASTAGVSSGTAPAPSATTAPTSGGASVALSVQASSAASVASAKPPASASSPLDQRDEPPLPQPREESAAAVADGKLYLMAGFDSAGQDTSSVFVYDGRNWSTGPALPAALDHPSAAALGSDVYLAGGFSNGPATPGLYRLSASKWQALAPMTHPRGALALVALAGRLYALGGIDKSEVGPAEAYDPANNRWTDLPPLPAPRDHVAGFTLGTGVCIAGGRTPNTPRVDCLEPIANAWARLPDLPQPTSGAGSVTLAGGAMTPSGDPIVAGGEGDRIIDQLARLRDGAWQADKMRVPRHGLQLAVLNGRAFACGGGTSPGLNAVAACTSIG